jgi:hypothetical protein
MKILILAALTACLALPAAAQDWGGAPLADPSLFPPAQPGMAGVGQVEHWSYFCQAPNGGILAGGQCSAGQIAGGARTQITNAMYNASGGYAGFNGETVVRLPGGAGLPGSNVGIAVQGGYADPTSPAGFSTFRGSVPLYAFASQAGVMDLNTRIDAFIDEQRAFNQRAADEQRLAYRGVALASSLSSLAPAQGKTNRIATGMASFAGETAMSVNYSHQSGSFDFGLGVAVSSGDGLGKASVGFSW